MSIFILFLALVLWGVVHSWLASHQVKNILQNKFSERFMRGYRLLYNVFAVITFAAIFYLMRILPDNLVYQVSAPRYILMFGGQLIALLIILLSVLQAGALSFLGLNQLFDKDKTAHNVTRGLYRFVRHPLYTGILLFIWLTPTMTQNSLTVYLGSTLYILVGAYFEEKKLVQDFGDEYIQYMRKVPMIIPGLKFGRK